MLVVSRKRGEAIKIGDEITIIIVDTTDNRAKEAIEAPAGVKILKSKIEERDDVQPGRT